MHLGVMGFVGYSLIRKGYILSDIHRQRINKLEVHVNQDESPNFCACRSPVAALMWCECFARARGEFLSLCRCCGRHSPPTFHSFYAPESANQSLLFLLVSISLTRQASNLSILLWNQAAPLMKLTGTEP
jgi:hypothetical protein